MTEKEKPMPKITTHLWYDKEAKEAAALYTSLLPDSRVKNTTALHDTPSGDVDIVTIELAGLGFTLLSAGPLFRFTPATSFLIACDTKEEVDRLFGELSKDGSVLMELGAYPFSERYGWLADRFGLSWQVMHAGDRAITQKIRPTLMFTGENAGRAEEAIRLYTSLFPNSAAGEAMRYGEGEDPDRPGTLKWAPFTLDGVDFAAMDSAHPHGFTFNEAVSFMVHCDTQEEIDHYWSALSADPRAEQCGWLKDQFGLSWQIVPTAMDRMMASGNPKKIAAVTQAFLQMKKFDIARLEEAYASA
jgi:predicted 3-demethylubiquinone-9 3-methyltransferase (glyoxalase superfamily)